MRSLVIGTAGHIDHGKSTLVRSLTGIDPDRLKEEQARGITIDLGFAHAQIGDVEVAFVDVPGHERFVRNMLAGAGGIDAVLLVVAADESVMPQTREHFHICRLLGLEHGVVAITKADVADAAMLGVVEEEVRALVADSGLAHAPVVRVSARTGAGLDQLGAAIAGVAGLLRREFRRDVVRLPIDRVFTMRGFGTVVTGTLVSGEVAHERELAVLPGERRVRVRGIQVHGRPATAAAAPHRIALNVTGVEKDALARGMTIASAGGLTVTKRFDARVQLLADAQALRHGARVRLHQGTAETAARVLIAAVRSGPGDPWRAIAGEELRASVPPGGEACVRLRLQDSMVVTRGDRFVLRALSPAATIGGGGVLDPEPPAGGLRRADSLTRFLELESFEQACRAWIAAAGVRGLPVSALVSRGGVSRLDAEAAARRLTDAHAAVQVDDVLFPASTVTSATDAVVRTLGDFHAAHPIEPGMPREALRDGVGLRSAPELFDHVVRAAAARGAIHGTERIALQTHRPAMSPVESLTRDRVLAAVQASGLLGSDAGALAQAAAADARLVEGVVRVLMREQQIVKLDGLYFDAAALRRLKADIQAWRNPSPGAAATLDVAAFKSRFGLTRKSAIPLLEWLDRERITRRAGEVRVIL